jgi:hypothetical protein
MGDGRTIILIWGGEFLRRLNARELFPSTNVIKITDFQLLKD